MQGSVRDAEVLLGEATFTCEHVGSVRITGSWMPVRHAGVSDKVYAVTGGRGRLILHDRVYRLEAGRVVLIPAGVMQQGFSDPDAPLEKHYVHFRSATAGAMHLLRLFPPPSYLRGAAARTIAELVGAMGAEWRGDRPGRELAVRTLLMRAMLTAYRAEPGDRLPAGGVARADDGGVVEATPSDAQYDAVRRALGLIAERERSPGVDLLTLPELAEAAGLSPAYFSRLFARLVGTPPMRFVEARRLRRAQTLLASSDRPVAWVGEQVGYRDAAYFSRVFQRLTGVPPSVYRQTIRFGHA